MSSMVYFIPSAGFMDARYSGVLKKVRGQCAAFERIGYSAALMYYADGYAIVEYKNEIYRYKTKIFRWKLGFCKKAIKNFFKDVSEREFAFAYIRKIVLIPTSFSYLKALQTSVGKVVVEIPTYPFAKENAESLRRTKSLLKKIYFAILMAADSICCKYLKRYATLISAITPLSECNEIFGLPAVKITNGIDLAEISIKKWVPVYNTISLIGVAVIAYWHGYDRVICGLHNYYKSGGKRNIIFHIVGEGEDMPRLKKLVAVYDINKHIIFHGTKTGQALNALFNEADIAVASLAHFRMDTKVSAPLKVREYCARQIPFICAGEDDAIDESFEWKLRIPANEEAVNMESVIAFYEEMVYKQDRLSEMRKFAEEYFQWDIQLKKIVDTLNLLEKKGVG